MTKTKQLRKVRTPEQRVAQTAAAALARSAKREARQVRTFDNIITDIAAGIAGFRAAPAHGIPFGTFWRWLTDNPDMAEKYVRAKQAGIERLADEIQQIADTQQPGVITKRGPDGLEVTTKDVLEHRRLQIDTRKWLLSKLLPHKYGEKIGVEHSLDDKLLEAINAARGRLIEHQD